MLYPNQEFEALKNALISHNESVIHTSIENIIIFMEQNQMPLYLARGICFELIRLVNEHCQGQKSVAGNSPIELSGMETAQEIIQLLHSWNAQLKDLTEQASKKAVDVYKRQLHTSHRLVSTLPYIPDRTSAFLYYMDNFYSLMPNLLKYENNTNYISEFRDN